MKIRKRQIKNLYMENNRTMSKHAFREKNVTSDKDISINRNKRKENKFLFFSFSLEHKP